MDQWSETTSHSKRYSDTVQHGELRSDRGSPFVIESTSMTPSRQEIDHPTSSSSSSTSPPMTSSIVSSESVDRQERGDPYATDHHPAIESSERVERQVRVNTTPRTSHFLTDLHAYAWLKLRVCRAHIICHLHVFVLTLFDYSIFFCLLTIFTLIILPFLLHQLHFPGGQIPCALSLMKTLAPLPSTTLSQVF